MFQHEFQATWLHQEGIFPRLIGKVTHLNTSHYIDASHLLIDCKRTYRRKHSYRIFEVFSEQPLKGIEFQHISNYGEILRRSTDKHYTKITSLVWPHFPVAFSHSLYVSYLPASTSH